MVVTGDQVVVGDVEKRSSEPDPEALFAPEEAGAAPVVGYETLCRRHYMRRVGAQQAANFRELGGDAGICAVDAPRG